MARPLAAGASHPADPWLEPSLRRAHEETVSALVPRLKQGPRPEELARLGQWEPFEALGWHAGASGGLQQTLTTRTTSAMVVSWPALISAQATWPLMVPPEGGVAGFLCAHESTVALTTAIFACFAGHFLSQIDGAGPIACALELANFRGAVSFAATHGRAMVVNDLPTAVDVTTSTTTSTRELAEAPEAVAQRLIDRWLVGFYEGPPIFGGLLD